MVLPLMAGMLACSSSWAAAPGSRSGRRCSAAPSARRSRPSAPPAAAIALGAVLAMEDLDVMPGRVAAR
ncbi:hypothetical protein [Amycolatopsis australiensis]|uniref:hypothetical protein n=1 Tax=Amycolatopsis australiensis TaxID=546364 RepID=UPI00092FFA96|nr:hypothetical protein [Amycolatopsis australiensis]